MGDIALVEFQKPKIQNVCVKNLEKWWQMKKKECATVDFILLNKKERLIKK